MYSFCKKTVAKFSFVAGSKAQSMSSSSSAWLTLSTFLLSNSVSVILAQFSADISNATGDYYFGQTNHEYEYGIIDCSNTSCHISCADYTCYSLTVIANQTESVTLDCSGAYSCAYLALDTKTLDIFSIDCLGSSACSSANINAENAYISDVYCSAQRACYNANFSFDDSTYLDVYCDSSRNGESATIFTIGACSNVGFSARSVSTFYLDCAQYDCYSSVWRLNDSSSSYITMDQYAGYNSSVYATDGSLLHLDCAGAYSCYNMAIGCPPDECQLTCSYSNSNSNSNINSSSVSACAQQTIMVDDDASDLSYDCRADDSSACSSTIIHCLDNDFETSWIYSDSDSSWGCGTDYDCCLEKTDIVCNSIAPTTAFTLSSAPTRNSLLPSAQPTSNPSAIDSTLMHQNCSISCLDQVSCQNAYFDASDTLSFDLSCYSGSSYACQYSTVICPENGDCRISCSESYACTHMNIIGSRGSQLYISCASSYSCYMLDIDASLAESVDIDCPNSYSCWYATLQGSTNMTSETTSVNISCTYGYACSSMVAETDYTANVRLYCHHTSSTYACQYFTLSSPYAESVDIDCNYYDCYDINVNVSLANYVDIYCGSTSACYSATIDASDAIDFNLNCSATSACQSSAIRCPSQNISVCSITCGYYSSSCESMSIVFESDFVIGSLELSCPRAPDWTACSSMTLECELYGEVVSSSEFYWYWSKYAYACRPYSCCPLSLGNMTCDANSDCVVSCNSSYACADEGIDGRQANSLTVYCNASYACFRTTIHCPLSSGANCHIYGSADRSLYVAKVYSSSSTNSVNLNVSCRASYACYYSRYYARDARRVHIICDAGTGNSSYYACYGARFHVQNATNVTLYANGTYSAFGVVIRVQRAQNVNISCISYAACASADFYLPDSYTGHTQFNCYAYGCADIDLYTHYVGSIINVDIHGCGICSSTSDCINYWDVNCYCPYGQVCEATDNVDNVDYWHGSYCYSGGFCDCDDIEAIFINDESSVDVDVCPATDNYTGTDTHTETDAETDTDSDTGTDTDSDTGTDTDTGAGGNDADYIGNFIHNYTLVIIVGGGVILACFCCLVIFCCRKRKQKRKKQKKTVKPPFVPTPSASFNPNGNMNMKANANAYAMARPMGNSVSAHSQVTAAAAAAAPTDTQFGMAAQAQAQPQRQPIYQTQPRVVVVGQQQSGRNVMYVHRPQQSAVQLQSQYVPMQESGPGRSTDEPPLVQVQQVQPRVVYRSMSSQSHAAPQLEMASVSAASAPPMYDDEVVVVASAPVYAYNPNAPQPQIENNDGEGGGEVEGGDAVTNM